MARRTSVHQTLSYCLNGLQEIAILSLGIVCTFFLLLFILFSTPVYIFRLFAIILAKYFRPDLGEILNGQSSLLVNDLFSGKTTRSNIVVTIIIQGKLTLQEMKKGMLKTWIRKRNPSTGELVFAKFQQYPVRWLGFTFYKNAFDTFRLENHLFLHESLSNHKQVNDTALNNFVEKLLNSNHPPERSPWEVHIIQNYKNSKFSKAPEEEMSVLLFKLHHSLGDGLSILTAIVEGIGCDDSLLNKKIHSLLKLPKTTLPEKIKFIVGFPFIIFYEFSYAISNIFRWSPWKIPDSKKKWYHVLAKSDLIPVEDIKLIKNSFDVSFTSVLLSAMSSAIHRNLFEEGKKSFEKKKVDSMYCMTLLPFPGHNSRLTNHVTAALFDMPCKKFHSSGERLRKVHQMIESSKKTAVPYVAFYFANFVGWHFYPVCREIFKNRMISTGLTNFPSVPINIEKDGKRGVVVDFVTGTHDGVAGVGIMTLGYSGYIRYVVTAENAIMTKKEINRFVGYIHEEIDKLKEEAKEKV